MSWTDVFVSAVVKDEEIRAAFAEAFGISAEKVLIGEERPDFGDVSLVTQHAVYCRIFSLRGDFPLGIECFAFSKAFLPENSLTMQIKVALAFGRPILVSDKEINPYSWLLIDAKGNVTTVLVDPDELDDHDAFVIQEKSDS